MDWILYIIAVFVLVTTFFLGYMVKSKEKSINNKQSSSIAKTNLLGKWISFSNPINIEEYLEPGDYVILRIEYTYLNTINYKLAWVDSIVDNQVKFHIKNMDISKTMNKITDFCILPEYNSDNFYKE